MWIDAHCHLADESLLSSIDAVLDRSKARGVTGWVQGGTWPDDWDRQLELKRKLGASFVTAFGVHPWWVAREPEANVVKALEALERKLPEAQAVGELGLDYAPKHEQKGQREAFERQLALARAAGKPLVLHIVKAHEPAIQALKAHGSFPAGGLVHAFSGSAEVGGRYLDLGFHLSVGGALLREGFQTLKKAVKAFPLERLCLETDSPDQAPEPANLLDVATEAARLRGMDREELLSISTRNLECLFRIKVSPPKP